jgi:hypothetical protein
MWGQALGEMDECIMALYGLGRLLQSRDLGPSQIVPMLDAFVSGIESRTDAIGRQVEAAGQSLTPPLRDVGAQVAGEAWRVSEALVAGFSRASSSEGTGHTKAGKLGAKRRLQLERITPDLGAQLQAVRLLVEQLAVAAAPQPMRMRLGDVLRGNWRKRPAFGGAQYSLLIDASGPDFEAEPRFLRAVVERAARMLSSPSTSDDATPSLLLLAERRENEIEVTVGSLDEAERTTVDRAVLLVSPGTPVDGLVLRALGEHHRALVDCGSQQARIHIAA